MTSLHWHDDVTNYTWCNGGYDSKMLFVKLFQFKNNSLFESRMISSKSKKAILRDLHFWP